MRCAGVGGRGAWGGSVGAACRFQVAGHPVIRGREVQLDVRCLATGAVAVAHWRPRVAFDVFGAGEPLEAFWQKDSLSTYVKGRGPAVLRRTTCPERCDQRHQHCYIDAAVREREHAHQALAVAWKRGRGMRRAVIDNLLLPQTGCVVGATFEALEAGSIPYDVEFEPQQAVELRVAFACVRAGVCTIAAGGVRESLAGDPAAVVDAFCSKHGLDTVFTDSASAAALRKFRVLQGGRRVVVDGPAVAVKYHVVSGSKRWSPELRLQVGAGRAERVYRDLDLVAELRRFADRTGLLDILVSVCAVASCTLERATALDATHLAESMIDLYSVAHGVRLYRAPDFVDAPKPSEGECANRGGRYTEAGRALYGHCAQLDLKSCYPRVAIAYKLSLEEPLLGERGLLAEIYDGLLAKREAATSAAYGKACKSIANTLYGSFSCTSSTYKSYKLGAQIAAGGRALKQRLDEMAERRGLLPVHGVTDSLTVTLEGAKDAEEMRRAAEGLRSAFNAEMREEFKCTRPPALGRPDCFSQLATVNKVKYFGRRAADGAIEDCGIVFPCLAKVVRDALDEAMGGFLEGRALQRTRVAAAVAAEADVAAFVFSASAKDLVALKGGAFGQDLSVGRSEIDEAYYVDEVLREASLIDPSGATERVAGRKRGRDRKADDARAKARAKARALELAESTEFARQAIWCGGDLADVRAVVAAGGCDVGALVLGDPSIIAETNCMLDRSFQIVY